MAVSHLKSQLWPQCLSLSLSLSLSQNTCGWCCSWLQATGLIEMFDNAHRTFRFRNVQQHPAKTATKRSHGCKHRFSVEHTALVATSLRFYCLCAIISPLSEKPVQLRFFFFFSHLNQTTLLSLWLWGWILAHALHCCSFYYLCSALHWRPREHFKAPSHLISPPRSVREIPRTYRNYILRCAYPSRPASFLPRRFAVIRW